MKGRKIKVDKILEEDDSGEGVVKGDFFVCKNCKEKVSLDAPGTQHRNHCPFCLYSRHLDVKVGDRKSKCKGMMKPIGIVKREDGERVLVHQCQGCGFISKNRIAGDDDDELLRKVEKEGKKIVDILL